MKVLIAEDENISRRRLEKALEDMNYEVISCRDGLEAWKAIEPEDAPHLLILDWVMPGMDGIELCRKARKQAKEIYTYILLLTSKGEEDDIIKGMEAGADDYITKPFNKHELEVRLKAGRRIVGLSKENLEIRDTLRTQAIRDGLTGLYNRRYMTEILEREFSRALRYQTDLSCLLFDIDFFKDINDTFGHAFGDLVLRKISTFLEKDLKKSDSAFRYGGEEFLILLPDTHIEGARTMAEKIRTTCETKTHNDGANSTTVTVSIGVASVKHHHTSESKELIAFADKALYHAKAEGRNRVKVYMEESTAQSADGEISKDKGFRYLKENLSSILEKTKKASIESLDLMVRDICASKPRKDNQKVSEYFTLIGERLRLPPSIIDTFKRSASLHENFNILLEKKLKSESKTLNTDKKTRAEDGPYMMAELTRLFDFFANERSVLLHHHENFDGTGYPEGLKGNEVPLGARIFAIVDAIVNLTSEQSFEKNITTEKVIEKLADNAGKQFDPMLVSLFFEIIEENKMLSVHGDALTKAKEKVSNLLSAKGP